MDKSLLLNLWYTLEWEVRNLTSETHTAQPLVSFCPSPTLHWADRRVGELPLSLCPFWSLSLSAWTGSELLFSLSISRFFFFFLLSVDCFGPLVWCTVVCFIYNTQSFFFLIPLTVILYCIYICIFFVSLLNLAL